MDQRFNAIINKLETTQRQTTLADFWKNYLTLQKNNLEESITKCEKIFRENNIHDIEHNALVTLYFLKSNMLNDLNE
tara:strand:+ start:575 stop:805 length:231 start_codon:yes stop_codon:yes gene_type:complete